MAVPRSREPSPPRPSSESDAPRLHRRLNFGATFPLLPALLLLLSELSEQLLISPRIRLLEASVCRAYYRSHDPSMLDPIDGGIDEQQCKITEVQAQLAHIRGWQVFWEAIPVMALAIPWGALADRIGRKKVLAVGFFGSILHILWFLVVCSPTSTLPAKAVWASGLAFILGGGPRTAGILIMALVTDISTNSTRSERFYYTYSAFLITELLAPPIASFLMARSVYYSFGVAITALLLCFPVLLAIRTWRPPSRSSDVDNSEAAAGLLSSQDALLETPPTPISTGLLPALKARLSSLDRNILLVLLGHFICPTRQELLFQILIPYASKVYSLAIASAGLLLSVVAVTNLAVFTLVLPRLPTLLRSRSPARTDRFTALASILLLGAGCVAAGVAPTLAWFVASTIVFAAGFGVRLSLLSLLTSLVDPGKIGRVYTLVTVVEGLGEMVSAVVLQEAWAWGLETGGMWRGTPWWIGAVVHVGAWAVVRSVAV